MFLTSQKKNMYDITCMIYVYLIFFEINIKIMKLKIIKPQHFLQTTQTLVCKSKHFNLYCFMTCVFAILLLENSVRLTRFFVEIQ